MKVVQWTWMNLMRTKIRANIIVFSEKKPSKANYWYNTQLPGLRLSTSGK